MSPSPSTVTWSFVRSIPKRAACAAITVEQHAAREARNNQPGCGPVPVPPIAADMSVSICSPEGLVTRHLRPFPSVAVAGSYLARAFSGQALIFSLKSFHAFAIGESVTMPSSRLVGAPGKNPRQRSQFCSRHRVVAIRIRLSNPFAGKSAAGLAEVIFGVG